MRLKQPPRTEPVPASLIIIDHDSWELGVGTGPVECGPWSMTMVPVSLTVRRQPLSAQPLMLVSSFKFQLTLRAAACPQGPNNVASAQCLHSAVAGGLPDRGPSCSHFSGGEGLIMRIHSDQNHESWAMAHGPSFHHGPGALKLDCH